MAQCRRGDRYHGIRSKTSIGALPTKARVTSPRGVRSKEHDLRSVSVAVHQWTRRDERHVAQRPRHRHAAAIVCREGCARTREAERALECRERRPERLVLARDSSGLRDPLHRHCWHGCGRRIVVVEDTRQEMLGAQRPGGIGIERHEHTEVIRGYQHQVRVEPSGIALVANHSPPVAPRFVEAERESGKHGIVREPARVHRGQRCGIQDRPLDRVRVPQVRQHETAMSAALAAIAPAGAAPVSSSPACGTNDESRYR